MKLSIDRFATKFLNAIKTNKFKIGKDVFSYNRELPCLDGSKEINVEALRRVIYYYITRRKFVNITFAHLEECKQVVLFNSNEDFEYLDDARCKLQGLTDSFDRDDCDLCTERGIFEDMEYGLNSLVTDALAILIINKVM